MSPWNKIKFFIPELKNLLLKQIIWLSKVLIKGLMNWYVLKSTYTTWNKYAMRICPPFVGRFSQFLRKSNFKFYKCWNVIYLYCIWKFHLNNFYSLSSITRNQDLKFWIIIKKIFKCSNFFSNLWSHETWICKVNIIKMIIRMDEVFLLQRVNLQVLPFSY